MMTFASARERGSRLRHSSRKLPLKLSETCFCPGLAGLDQRGADPLRDDPRHQDRDGNLRIINYRPEFLMNAVLASIFARLSGCPGTEVCSSFLDYDPRNMRHCSVQPYIKAHSVAQCLPPSP